jgi:hypothetical protein
MLATELSHVGRRLLLNVRPGGGVALGRFDCPLDLGGLHSSHFGVWYGATTDIGALCEYFVGKARVVTLQMRRTTFLGRVDMRGPVIDLRNRAPLSIYPSDPIDNRIGNQAHYSVCQSWSAALHACGGLSVAGLQYTGRRGGEFCVALYEHTVPTLVVRLANTSLADPMLDALWVEFEDVTGIAVLA